LAQSEKENVIQTDLFYNFMQGRSKPLPVLKIFRYSCLGQLPDNHISAVVKGRALMGLSLESGHY